VARCSHGNACWHCRSNPTPAVGRATQRNPRKPGIHPLAVVVGTKRHSHFELQAVIRGIGVKALKGRYYRSCTRFEFFGPLLGPFGEHFIVLSDLKHRVSRPRTHKWARFPLRSESDRIAAAQRNNARCHEPTPRPGEVIKQELGSDVLHKQRHSKRRKRRGRR
jgi:hypothetical protein